MPFLPQVDNKGRNFLHVAVQNSDIESVLFLISVQANVNSRVQDASKLTPLHLAVQAGSEIIVRNLVCAGESPFLCFKSAFCLTAQCLQADKSHGSDTTFSETESSCSLYC